jgi:hypothetical protein
VAAALVAAATALFEPAAAASRCEISGAQRIVAIGDVHGSVDRFTEILKAVNLIDDKARWSGGAAHLVQLGDVVDRGPDSRAALDLLRRLEGEAERAGGAVHALLGNHEVARILGDMRFANAGEYAAFATPESEMMRQRYLQTVKSEERDQAMQSTPLGMVEMRAAFGRQGSYGEWLRKHDAVVKINGVLFVHGGISPAVAAMSCETINNTVRKELTDDIEKTRSAPLVSLAAREDGPFWYRGLAKLQDTDSAAIEGVLSQQHVRAVVIAHSVTANGRVRMQFDGKLFQIDTGMQPAYAQGGRASALEFVGTKVSAVYIDRRDPLLDSF